MPRLTTNDIIEVVFVTKTDESQFTQNVRHWIVSNHAGDGIELSVALSSLSTLMAPLYKDIIIDTHAYVGAKGRKVRVTASQFKTTLAGAGFGGVAGDPLPSQVAGTVKLVPLEGPPHVFGRMYLPPAFENANDASGRPTAAYSALVENLMDEMLDVQTFTDGGDSVTLTPVIWRRGTSQFWQIEEFQFRQWWATRKSRSEINKGDGSPI